MQHFKQGELKLVANPSEDGVLIAGLTVTCAIQRITDGKWWNGTANTWDVSKVDNATAYDADLGYVYEDADLATDGLFFYSFECLTSPYEFLVSNQFKMGDKDDEIDNIETLSGTIDGKVDTIDTEVGVIDGNVNAIKNAVESPSYGLSALKVLIDLIDTSTELQARFCILSMRIRWKVLVFGALISDALISRALISLTLISEALLSEALISRALISGALISGAPQVMDSLLYPR